MTKDFNKTRFDQLVKPQLAMLMRSALALTNDQNNAEDLVQETAIKAFRSIDKFQGENCKAWLLTIMRRVWIDNWRKQQRQPETQQLDEQLFQTNETVTSHISSPEQNPDSLLETISDERLLKAISQLPDEQRWTILLTDMLELDHQSVATILNVAEGTIKSRTSRVRKQLKESLLPKKVNSNE